MEERFWGKDMQDIFYWTKRLQMVVKVRELDENKFFKIAKLNLKGKVQYWCHRFDPPPKDWKVLQALLHLKYGVYDENELKTKMDVMC
jgi:hypothetical protein